ncbi:hypothetical protein [Paraburkholderia heleia]|uniref:hypothetical protein n=1 Tax=Paraburkholderia heleia TaxID=634127 RepID=UPI0005A68B06|nr:hypothetical protein [Paraburkholderia heleia]
MTSNSHAARDVDTEALATLSEYLELALDKGGSLILVRTPGGKNEVYLGDPALLPEDWTHLGAIAEPVARAILDGTRSGLNELTIQAQNYRFVRLFAQAADVGAIVFVTA